MGIKFVNIIFILLSTFSMVNVLYAQKSLSLDVIEKENIEYYKYIIQEKTTLYDLSQQWSISTDDLLNANPGIERGIKKNDTVFIPVERKSFSHVVQAKQTLYAISKLYYVDINSLIKANPGVENGIQIGSVLRINNGIFPMTISSNEEEHTNEVNSKEIGNKNVKINDSLLQYFVNENESIFSIARRYKVSYRRLMEMNELTDPKLTKGQKILIPLSFNNDKRSFNLVDNLRNYDTLFHWSADSIDEIHIVFCLPFGLRNVSKRLNSSTAASTDFYMGSTLAFDSLEKLEINAKVDFIDYLDTNTSLIETLDKLNSEQIHLLYAPMDPSYYHELNSWAIQNNTMIIYPLKVNDELLFENNNSIAYQTKEEILIARLGRECAKSKMKTILIKSEENENLERIFANEFNNNLNSGDFNLITTNLLNYKNFKKPTDTVNYVLLSDNEEKVEKFMMENSVVDKINKKYRSTKEDIKVYGKESWTNFVNITQVIENNYSFNYTSDEDFNYLDEKVKELHYRFRNEFQCDLSKYACLGYDMTFNVLSYLLLDYSKFEGNMTAVMFEKQFPFTGFQNTHSYFLKFDNFVSTRY